MTIMTIEDVEEYGGVGDHTQPHWTLAIDLAEFDIGHALNTHLEPTTVALEEHMWPHGDGRLKLNFNKVTGITLVTALHNLDQDCVWDSSAECGVILRGETGLIVIKACNLNISANCNCGISGLSPSRAVITYVSGFTDAEMLSTTSLGKALRMAINLRARDWLGALEQNDFWDGQHVVKGFSSMDYSEQREFLVQKANPFGPGELSEAAWRIVKKFRPYPALMVRSSGRL